MKALVVDTPDGKLGSCTAKCYDAAPDTVCECICGGLNHAKGRSQAGLNAPILARKYKRAKVSWDERLDQQEMFQIPSKRQHGENNQ